MVGNARHWARNAKPHEADGLTLSAIVFQIESWLKRLCAVGLILLMQGPALLMQEAAWAKMLVSYTSQRGLVRGVVETFDGKHPCKMCAKAAELRKNEGKGDPLDRPQKKENIRLTWGEMLDSNRLVLPDDYGTDCQTLPAYASHDAPGRGKDTPVLPPPERA